ncbi:MAG: ribosome small subunit-dependent GTPase A [Bdellovibrionales bacterium]|nr:ribosome small subunit-dependent GTPase A [Bdellovibrionales bacterium]
MTQPIPWLTPDVGLVVSTTRRWTDFHISNGTLLRGTAATKALDITVGDFISYSEGTQKGYLITEIFERKNLLSRQIGAKVRRLASNIDHLYIVTALGALFNTHFIDRIMCTAHSQDIPCSLIVNKCDLELDTESEKLIDVYQSLELEVLLTSTKQKRGLESLYSSLSNTSHQVICLAGVSGVGKSSILNLLVPEAERETGKVSEKTGQGRQTTSQAFAYPYLSHNQPPIFIVDLPGVQNFGITHLSRDEIEQGFAEFAHLSQQCEYGDCRHIAEEICGVKSALAQGALSDSRYQSYLNMLEEQERFREY